MRFFMLASSWWGLIGERLCEGLTFGPCGRKEMLDVLITRIHPWKIWWRISISVWLLGFPLFVVFQISQPFASCWYPLPHNPQILLIWKPPLSDMIELNFDWSMGGNPGKAGTEGILRLKESTTVLLFLGPVGFLLGQKVEHEAWRIGLSEAHHANLHRLLVEGIQLVW